MIAVIGADLADARQFAESHALGSPLLISPRNSYTARGRTLAAAFETPAFRNRVSSRSRQEVREVVAPAMCVTGGEFIAPKE